MSLDDRPLIEGGFATLSSNARPAPTNGWDVVSATRICDLNAAILHGETSPKDFAYKHENGYEGSGKFDAWQIGPNGDGPLINLRLPIRDFVVRHGGKETRVPFCEATIRIQLDYMPSGRNLLMSDGNEAEEFLLVVRTDIDQDRLMVDPTERVVRVSDITEIDEFLARQQTRFLNVLEEWLNENIVHFRHVFGTVNLVKITQEQAEGEAFGWMKPTSMSYAFGKNRRYPENSVLSILCQTAGRGSDGLVQQTQADAIPDGANAALCISNRRLIRDMLAPGLEFAYPGIKLRENHFMANDTGILINDTVHLAEKEFEGKTYSPTLTRLEALVRTTDLKFDSRTRTEVSKGIYSLCHNTSWYSFGLIKGSKGLTMGFKQAQESVETHESEKDPAVNFLQWMGRALAFLGGALLLLTGIGAVAVSAALIAGLLIGGFVLERGPDIVEMVKGNDGPPIDALLLNADMAITWSAGGSFEPTVVGLNGSLQIGGKLTVPSPKMMMANQLSYQDRYRAVMGQREMPA